ncbi:gamma-glutamyltransferase [Alcaligenaceae bacterium]|nr:gamma-glutamyltransferase [Alcaligenaceae bacterium]
MSLPATLRLSIMATLLVTLAACGSTQHANRISPQAAQQTAAGQAANAAYNYSLDIFHPVVAHHGMVSTEQKLASKVGLDILKAGGNAIDAAVGIGFALAVVLPNAGNLGGGGFMVSHNGQSGANYALDFREMAPNGASRTMYLDTDGNVINDKSLHSHYAVGVPGTVAGLGYAHKLWGSMSWSNVIAPAISLASEGIKVSETLATVLDREKSNMGKWPATTAIFWRNGAPMKAGDLLVQKDLAQSMRLIAQQGPQAFYTGTIGQKIAAEMANYPGAITMNDLRNYAAIERTPVTGHYRGHDIVTMPPPSSGGIHLVQMLNILERWPLADWGHNSARSIHHMAEAMKLAYADRSEYLGDPDYVKIPLQGLTSKAYADELAKGITDKARPSSSIKPGKPQPYESDQTTHFSVMDSAGNAVAVTYTLNTNFGSGIVAAGTGIMLNNEMDDFAAKPGAANAYGLIGGDANSIQPGKRPLSSMTPTLVMKDGKPVLVTGSPGGSRIITIVLQTLLDTIDFQMNPAEAASAVRVHHQWTPDELHVEKGLSIDTRALLLERGHHVVTKAAMGRTQTIQRLNGVMRGYSDPRNPDGDTLGY